MQRLQAHLVLLKERVTLIIPTIVLDEKAQLGNTRNMKPERRRGQGLIERECLLGSEGPVHLNAELAQILEGVIEN